MRVLVLGSSNDTVAWLKSGPTRQELVRDRLAAEFGEPVVVGAKNAWPNDRLVAMVNRWVTEFEPDVVYLNVTTFPFSYESLPVRIETLLGPFGTRFSRAGFQLADSNRPGPSAGTCGRNGCADHWWRHAHSPRGR